MSDLWNQVKMQFKDFPAEIRDRIQAEQQEVIEEAVLRSRCGRSGRRGRALIALALLAHGDEDAARVHGVALLDEDGQHLTGGEALHRQDGLVGPFAYGCTATASISTSAPLGSFAT